MDTLHHDDFLIITGAAGLVGQNLVAELRRQGYSNMLVIDKHEKNLAVLQSLHPAVRCVCADMSQPGPWTDMFADAKCIFLLQAQITGATYDAFQRNTLDATRHTLDAARNHRVPFTIFVGSSVVNSVADDHYTRSKKAQEAMVAASGLPHCVVRPTLMFGWFDPKHLGWLSRFMAKTPVFPIPGHGRYIRQPLYVRDFCRVLIWCAQHPQPGEVFDIVGEEDVTYVDIIRAIKKTLNLSTLIVHLPVPLFRLLMRGYGMFSKNPPFVVDQLDALMAGDYFSGENMQKRFGITPTPFATAIEEVFHHPQYSHVVLQR